MHQKEIKACACTQIKKAVNKKLYLEDVNKTTLELDNLTLNFLNDLVYRQLWRWRRLKTQTHLASTGKTRHDESGGWVLNR